MRRVRGSDEHVVQVLVQKLAKRRHLEYGKGVHPSEWRFGTFFKVDLEVIRLMRQESTGLELSDAPPLFYFIMMLDLFTWNTFN